MNVDPPGSPGRISSERDSSGRSIVSSVGSNNPTEDHTDSSFRSIAFHPVAPSLEHYRFQSGIEHLSQGNPSDANPYQITFQPAETPAQVPGFPTRSSEQPFQGSAPPGVGSQPANEPQHNLGFDHLHAPVAQQQGEGLPRPPPPLFNHPFGPPPDAIASCFTSVEAFLSPYLPCTKTGFLQQQQQAIYQQQQGVYQQQEQQGHHFVDLSQQQQFHFFPRQSPHLPSVPSDQPMADLQSPMEDLGLDLNIQVPARRWPQTLPSVTPGRSLTSSVLGRGPTPDIRTLYRFDKAPLGEGQYGKVYRVTELATGKVFACKSIARSTLVTVEDVEDIRAEVKILFHLQGKPNIVRIQACFEDRLEVHIVMELCSGGELFDEINRRCEQRAVPYSERDAAKLCKAVVRAVHSCHTSNVIHRDLKPENFLLSSPAPDAVLKGADFGMAAFVRPGAGFTRVCGSCMYMAPEIIRLWDNESRVPYGPSVDIWAAGVICYILLTGTYPFLPQGNDRSERAIRRVILNPPPLFTEPVWRRISPGGRSLIASMLHPTPKMRPSAEEVLRHPWVESAPEEALEREVVDRFKQFLYVMRLKKVKRVALRAIAETMSEEDIIRVRSDISSLDPEATGVVAVEELPRCLARHGFDAAANAITSIIDEICLDGRVSFDYSDFFVAVLQLSAIEQQENLFKAFSVYDQDLSGYISADELKRACDKYRVNKVVVMEMMREVARDESGRVDYNEFVAMIRMEAGGVSRRTIEQSIESGSFKEMGSSDSYNREAASDYECVDKPQ